MNQEPIKNLPVRKDAGISIPEIGKVLKRKLINADERAKNIIESAQAEADMLVERAKLEAKKITAEAYRNGHDAAMTQLIGTLLELKTKREKLLDSVEEDALKLSVRLAEKIVGRQIEINKHTRLEIIHTAFQQVKNNEVLTIRVNASDLPLIEEIRDKFKTLEKDHFCDFITDSSVISGGCIIDCAAGTHDLRLETQLKAFERVLLSKFKADREKMSSGNLSVD